MLMVSSRTVRKAFVGLTSNSTTKILCQVTSSKRPNLWRFSSEDFEHPIETKACASSAEKHLSEGVGPKTGKNFNSSRKPIKKTEKDLLVFLSERERQIILFIQQGGFCFKLFGLSTNLKELC